MRPAEGSQAKKEKGGSLSTRRIGLIVLIAAGLLYFLLLARGVDPDGPHFAKSLQEYSLPYTFFPGHVLYGPACREFWLLWKDFGYHGNPLLPMQALNAVAGAFGVMFFFFATARLFPSRKLQLILTAALATSFGYWSEATYFVKPYALSMAFMMMSLWLLIAAARRASLIRSILAGAAAAGATTFHITNIFWAVFAFALIMFCTRRPAAEDTEKRHGRRVPRNAIVVVAVQILLVGAVYLHVYNKYILLQDPSVRGPGGVAGWVRSADHGYTYGFSEDNFRDSLYGFARAIYYVNDMLEGPIERMAVGVVIIYALLIFILAAGIRLWPDVPAGVKRFLPAAVIGAAPYIILGLQFFSKDPERWIWIVPLLIILAGGVIAAWVARPRFLSKGHKYAIAAIIVLALAANSFFRMILPRHYEDSYAGARYAASFLKKGDLLISPGHGWDDCVWLFNNSGYNEASAAYFAYYGPSNPIDIFRDPGTREAERYSLDRRIKDALAAGGDVYAVRIFDPHDTYHAWFVSRDKGFTGAQRDELIEYARAHFDERETVKFFMSYFSYGGRTDVLGPQLGEETMREIAMTYYRQFYNDYKSGEEEFAYYLNHEEYLQVKDYFDRLAPQYDPMSATKPSDIYVLWRSLSMIPLDARLYKLYLSQYKWEVAGDAPVKVWRMVKPGEGKP
jgi:hypothetical protein